MECTACTAGRSLPPGMLGATNILRVEPLDASDRRDDLVGCGKLNHVAHPRQDDELGARDGGRDRSGVDLGRHHLVAAMAPYLGAWTVANALSCASSSAKAINSEGRNVSSVAVRTR